MSSQMVTPDRTPATTSGGGSTPGEEPALLVEDAVVGEEPLAVAPDAPALAAAAAARPAVGQAAARPGRCPRPDTPTHSPLAAATRSRPARLSAMKPAGEQVLGRVAGELELGEDDQVAARPLGGGQRGETSPRCPRGRPPRGSSGTRQA